MNERKALKLALEAWENGDGIKLGEILKEALAQPEHLCVACEGNPKGNNNPCAVCGLAQPEQEPVRLLNALKAAREWIGETPHAYNCFLHDDGEYNRCFCGKDSLEKFIEEVLAQTEQKTDPCIDGSCDCCWKHLDE